MTRARGRRAPEPRDSYADAVPRIAYYAHHQGHGHLHRGTAVSRATAAGLDGFSTHARPAGWNGSWTRLPDDSGAAPDPRRDAGGALHYAPIGHPGYTARMRRLAASLTETDPVALVADVSVEVAVLARLLGVGVVTVALPGLRDDAPHRLGYAVSDLVVGPWPDAAAELLDTGDSGPRPVAVGAISRFPVADGLAPLEERRVLVLAGSGGTDVTDERVAAAARQTVGWDWTSLSPRHWVEDPWPLLQGAAVVVSHCGQNAVAEIAAARRPAVLVPQDRPFGEQRQMARVLRDLGLPAVVLDSWPEPDRWDRLLKEAAELDPAGWALWNDGRGAERFAALLETR